MLIKENYAVAEFKDIVNYKIKWILKVVYKFYMNYVELYDFDNLL